jgi:uroporphyrin-III C-methyltransferase/precorrin-2 dehydrogenase/sirohydrochlorin ferrochelatase/uroporphyrin-III C-methyltransferase
MQQHARIYLVGAGPGDPDLLTVRALRLIQQADTVIYDRLVSPEILRLIPRQAARIYVGKATSRHTLCQEDINTLLVEQADTHKTIVRLKGGDPYIFGRGGEEALALVRHGIAFEVVPGISAGQACAAYAGIPLTHRGLASGVRFITGHCRNNDELVIDARTLADDSQTLVIYMGLANLGRIVKMLLQAGRKPYTPAAIIERGTTPQQRNFITTIGDLQVTAKSENVQSPALLVVGDVVSLAAELGNALPDRVEAELRYA